MDITRDCPRKSDARQTSYSYDAHDRITGASTGTSSTSQSYGYDSDNNLTTENLGGTTTTLAYNSDDQLCWTVTGTSANGCASAPSGSTTYVYDAAGNQTSSSAGESLSYNSVGQTTSMTPAGGSALAMAYTGTDSTERTAAGSTTLTNSIFGAASSTTGSTTTYFTRDAEGRLNSILVGSTRYYVFYDGAGSVAGLITTSGTQVASYSYDPYGKTTATGTQAAADPLRFEGGYQDTSGFYKFGTRYLNPTLGSWTQEDPASLNYLEGYTFAGDDPVNLADPSGEFSAVNLGIIIVVAGAFLAGGGIFIGGGVALFDAALLAAGFDGSTVGAAAAAATIFGSGLSIVGGAITTISAIVSFF